MQPLSLIDKPHGVRFLDAMKNRVGARLKAIVAELADLERGGLNQVEVARKCGLSPSRFNNYLADTRTPDIDTVIRMATKLGVTTDYLLGVSESPVPDIAEVVCQLLELEGMDPVRASVVADTAQEALRLLLALPDEGDAETRSRIAAQAAWQLRGGPKPLQ
jgi:transcriptional regulator with XRE-family HTH domain